MGEETTRGGGTERGGDNMGEGITHGGDYIERRD